MTFSIVARDEVTGDLGIAVASKFPSVGSLVPWIDLEGGAIATQAFANLEYGRTGIKLLTAGASASQTLEILLGADELKETRQVGIVDTQGNAASFTGSECYEYAGSRIGKGYCCQGNILVDENTLEAMVTTFEITNGDLAEKLLSALEAGNKAGGDARGQQSAHLLVKRRNGGYGGGSDIYIDVRVDDHPEAVKELRRVFELYSLTLLEREDPDDITPLSADLLFKINQKLLTINEIAEIPSSEDAQMKNFTKWLHKNNFENKERSDGSVWNSILDNFFKTE